MSSPTLLVDNYIISRNTEEAQRLNVQHRCIMICQGYYIHPNIAFRIEQIRIADICTGTAIWLCEVALANPSTERHGFDISNTMFADQDTLPPNARLRMVDANQPFAKQWLEYFDVVHIRLIQAAMKKEEWATMLRNITTLLKTGEWLQWFEDDRAVAVRHAFRPAAPAMAGTDSLSAKLGQSQWKPPHILKLARFNRLIMPDDKAEAMNFGTH